MATPAAPFPANLAFNPTERTLSGLPIARFGPRELLYSVLDANGATTSIDFFFGDIRTDTPTFQGESIADQSYPVNIPIPDLTLPIAAGGGKVSPSTSVLIYSLTSSEGSLPTGLDFEAATRILSGTPTSGKRCHPDLHRHRQRRTYGIGHTDLPLRNCKREDDHTHRYRHSA